MDKEAIKRYANDLDAIANNEDDVEFWYARDVMAYMNYSEWRAFSKAISRARNACENSGIPIEAHFRDVKRNVELGKGATRSIDDVKLTRYACYLIAQNGDPKKEEVALLQSYFAVQTRTAELLEQRMGEIIRLAGRQALTAEEKMLSKNIYERSNRRDGFAIVRSRGDEALFNHSTKDMKQRLGVPERKPLADRLHPINVTAKQLAAQMTNYGIEEQDLHGLGSLVQEHVENNQSVRAALVNRGIKPEDLPAVEDIKNVEKRAKHDEKRIEGTGFKEE
ncbi:DNA damage-inducible protein D [Bifidobacterium scardovii]|uniref:DNA-damage-inducible protein D n=1 Tax=Bifidobacterium scardovii TaxID=158787 RepID=A0A087DGS0_9BIFI|nr:DNA damage-inducible protein D [Bifidobacterium scardovii]DAE55471.1 MAG TPA: DNA-damage-inducible protein D [Caudoviricetes sp.]KFI94720.1 DNA-damage-inducible protein D [Bifidobacterium scardovii]MDK6349854.1 DNA damage-inducible protein D [Bifidobacterium scardovii]MDU8982558.1 DNA damage-inducible protein D [Bifidobacterium scardovii]BAQ32058.1 DNA-damage-inducible protein [Bifidobacterium scardovii JCM 12489 = DSM 13734]